MNPSNWPAPPPPPPMPPMPPTPPPVDHPDANAYRGQAITAFVLGCLGLLVSVFSAVPAIVFALVAMRGRKRLGLRRDGLATAGLVLGVIFTAMFALLLLGAFIEGFDEGYDAR